MTTETLEAIFEHGIFRLLQPANLPLRDGQRVRLVVETDVSPDAILALAASVYDGFSPQDITDVEQIALQRQDFFGDADILIAATGIEHELVVVTNNTDLFANWELAPILFK